MSAAEENKKVSDLNMPPNEADPPAAAAAAAKIIDPETEPLNPVASSDPKVKFIGGKEATVDVESGAKLKDQQGSLTKSELMKYATDPFWVKLRWTLFILFWIGWVAMLVVSIVIIIMAPKCPSPNPKQWWQKAPVYEVYVKSFKDSDGNGIGDINGVTSKLDYLANLGIGSVKLSPIFKSPMKDHGYDVSDYKAIDETFGTMEDFKNLVNAMHDLGLKLIMDFIPNHSSDKHVWFEKSVKKEEPYTDYYIWADGKNGGPPNNWKSIFGESAWAFNAERGQYYLHQFYTEQPDLNLRNPKVVDELKDGLKFWLDQGVDGFRVDSVGHFFEDESLADEAPAADGGSGYQSLVHDKTYDLDEVLELLKTFRQVLDDATTEENDPKVMMTESYMRASKLARYYGNVADSIGDISHMPLNFNLISDFGSKGSLTALALNESIHNYLGKLPNNSWPNFCIGNHDHSRVASRLGDDKVDLMNMVLLALPGTPFTYYGEEIGMTDGSGSGERDPFRTPMQWNSDSPNAGFTDGTPWIPVNGDYTTVNVEALESVLNSHTKIYREMASLRQSDTILFGDTVTNVTETVFMLARIKKGNPGYLVISNLGSSEVTVSPSLMRNVATRGLLTMESPDTSMPIGSSLDLESLVIPPGRNYLVTFVPKM